MDDVDSKTDVASTCVASGPPGKTHRCLAAAVMEELDVRAAEVSIENTVQKAVETGFGQREPGQKDDDAGRHLSYGTHLKTRDDHLIVKNWFENILPHQSNFKLKTFSNSV